MKRTAQLSALATIVALALLLSGCGLVAQKAVENATGVKVDQGGGKTTVTGPNGQSATIDQQSGKVPDGLPATVPVYQGTISGSTSVNTPDGQSYTFTTQTTDDVATVLAWYKTQLAEKGWTVDAAAVMGTDRGLVSAKNGTTQLAVTVESGNGSSKIMTVVTVK